MSFLHVTVAIFLGSVLARYLFLKNTEFVLIFYNHMFSLVITIAPHALLINIYVFVSELRLLMGNNQHKERYKIITASHSEIKHEEQSTVDRQTQRVIDCWEGRQHIDSLREL